MENHTDVDVLSKADGLTAPLVIK